MGAIVIKRRKRADGSNKWEYAVVMPGETEAYYTHAYLDSARREARKVAEPGQAIVLDWWET